MDRLTDEVTDGQTDKWMDGMILNLFSFVSPWSNCNGRRKTKSVCTCIT